MTDQPDTAVAQKEMDPFRIGQPRALGYNKSKQHADAESVGFEVLHECATHALMLVAAGPLVLRIARTLLERRLSFASQS